MKAHPAVKDKILLKNLQAFCKLGSYDSERILGQCVFIQLELELDLSKAGLTNSIEDTVNYVDVSVMTRELAQSREFYLVENLAQEILQMIFTKFEKIEGISIEIHKTIVNAEQFTGDPAIKLYRTRS